jgi:Acetyltransferases, including N-acetylases of ribosomal proteins
MKVTLKTLTINDLQLLQTLLEKCSDYLAFQDGEPVKPSAAQDLFKARPEGIDDNDKVILGIFNASEQLVGVFDLIKSYPNSRTLTLGLMILDTFSRGKGLGSIAFEILEEWAVSKKFNKIRLGVLFGNEKGLRFWKKMGLMEIGEVKQYLSHKVLVLEKNI